MRTKTLKYWHNYKEKIIDYSFPLGGKSICVKEADKLALPQNTGLRRIDLVCDIFQYIQRILCELAVFVSLSTNIAKSLMNYLWPLIDKVLHVCHVLCKVYIVYKDWLIWSIKLINLFTYFLLMSNFGAVMVSLWTLTSLESNLLMCW